MSTSDAECVSCLIPAMIVGIIGLGGLCGLAESGVGVRVLVPLVPRNAAGS